MYKFKYIRIALRSLLKFRVYTIVTILGLAIGLTTSAFLVLYLRHDLGYDRFFRGSDRIFRVLTDITNRDGQELSLSTTLGHIAPVIPGVFPEIEAVTRVYNENALTTRSRLKNPDDHDFFYADPSFFRVFALPLLTGDTNSALAEPFSIVFTRSFARKICGGTEIVGDTIRIHGNLYTITGVLDDLPTNSHLRFNMLMSFSTFDPDSNLRGRSSLDFTTYIRLPQIKDDREMTRNIEGWIDSRVMERYAEEDILVRTSLQPLRQIHLGSAHLAGLENIMRTRKDMLVFAFLVLFVLIITVSNYTSLLAANSEYRAVEISVRKIVGAVNRDIFIQLILESFFISFIAFNLSVLFIENLAGPFSRLMNVNIRVTFFEHLYLLVLFFFISCLLGIASTVGPALFLSRRHKAHAQVRGDSQGKPDRLKIAMVILQFSVATFLVAVLILFFFQARFLQNMDLGYKEKQILLFYDNSRTWKDHFGPVREELLKHPVILSVANSGNIPGDIFGITQMYPDGRKSPDAMIIHEYKVGGDFIETYDLKILEGRNFSDVMDHDTGKFIINETAARMSEGMMFPGCLANVWYHRDTVIGIIRDFHFASLHDPVPPLVLTRYSPHYRYISLRLSEEDTQDEVIDYTYAVLDQSFPGHRFNHIPMEELNRQMFEKDRQKTRLFATGAIVAILVSIMGLFGLSSLTVVHRTKEIGIRKAVGASLFSVHYLMIKQIISWIVLAILIALPFAVYAVWNLKKAFAFQPGHLWLSVPLASVISLLVATITISIHVISMARKKPVDSLRYE